MFAVYCPVHRSRVLLSAESIETIESTNDGIDVHYTCHCGYRGVWRTGRSQNLAPVA